MIQDIRKVLVLKQLCMKGRKTRAEIDHLSYFTPKCYKELGPEF